MMTRRGRSQLDTLTCTEETRSSMAIVCHDSPATVRGFCVSGGGFVDAFTVTELARHYGKAAGTIGRWICEDRISGRRDPANGRRKIYPLDAVQRAYDKRHGAAQAA